MSLKKCAEGKLPSNMDQTVIDALLADDYELLDVLCHLTLVGDSAAVASKGILKLLARQEDGAIEVFLKRILRTRIVDYRLKSRDLSDITRDNTLVTMLLVAYAKSEGAAYLSQTLTSPLSISFPLLSQCEVDAQKVAKGLVMTPEEIDAKIIENRRNLELVCERIFSHVFDSRKKIPATILEMSRFLASTIDEVIAMDAMDPPTPNLEPRKMDEVHKTKLRMMTVKRPPAPISDGSISRDPSLIEDALVGDKYWRGSYTNLDASRVPSTNDSSLRQKRPPPSDLAQEMPLKSPQILYIENELRKPIVAQRLESNTLGNLGVSEKIIGSFLFLRFLVPGSSFK